MASARENEEVVVVGGENGDDNNGAGALSAASSSARERALTSFASLLSSALTVEGNLPEPLAGSSSALRCFFSSRVGPLDACAALPGLDLRAGKGAEKSSSSAAAVGTMGLEESAAFSLAFPVLCRREDLVGVPRKILANVASSFVQLVDARTRSSLSALLRRTAAPRGGALPGFGAIGTAGGGGGFGGGVVGGDAHTKTMIALLTSETPVAPTTVVTSFRVLPGGGASAPTEGGGSDPAKLILPLVYEAVVDLSILGTAATVAIHAPGTIAAVFDSDSAEDGGGNGGDLLRTVEVTLDTLALLRAMMKQARFAVKKAVSTASAIATTLVAAQAGAGGGRTAGGSLNLLGQNLGAGAHRKFERRSWPVVTADAAMLPPRRPSGDKKELSSDPPCPNSAGERSMPPSSSSSPQVPHISTLAQDRTGADAEGDAPPHKQQNFDMPPPPPGKPLRGCYSSPALRSSLTSALATEPRYSSYRPVMPLGPLGGPRTKAAPAAAAAVGRSPSTELRNVRFKDLTVSDGGGGGNKNAEWGTASSDSGGGRPASKLSSAGRCLDSAVAAQALAMLASTSSPSPSSTSSSPPSLALKKRARHSEAGASLAAAAAAAAVVADEDDGGSSGGPIRKRRVMSCPSIV